MSREAFESYQQALDLQHQRNEARHIRTRVHEARQAPHVAGLRWPFELLQNALDAGPRPGHNAVTVVLRHEPATILFEHNGAPFTTGELAALLSGGSSKEFGSEKTTGRFGTGFLVTHVLAEHASLEGLVSVDGAHEQFRLALDRSGDEDAILDNIQSCNDAIMRAEGVRSIDGLPSARFEYPLDNNVPLAVGVEAFRSALPYLFATCPSLGQVVIVDEAGEEETWTPDQPVRGEVEGGHLDERRIRVDTQGGDRTYQVLRFAPREDTSSAALVLLEQIGADWCVRVPDPTEPRIYSQYPLRGSGFVPMAFIFDGRFEPDQERNRALMNDADREALSEAFNAAVVGVRHASAEGWKNAHLLSRAAPPFSTFDPDDSDEADWWRTELRSFATRVAELPIVQTAAGFLPASSAIAPYADFVVPRLLEASTSDETTIDRLWPLVEAATELFPPVRELASDWSETAAGWNALGLSVNLITVEVLAGYVRANATKTDEIGVSGDSIEWLAQFIDVVGECWTRRNGIERIVLAGLFPNQCGDLCSASDLRMDAGVPEKLKDIGNLVGLNLRSGLLSRDLAHACEDDSFSYASEAVATVIPERADEGDAIDELLEHLRLQLPEDEECLESHRAAQNGSIEFLRYLWGAKGADAVSTARQVPLINRSARIAYWNSERVMMAPVSVWGEAARDFRDVYPPERVLDELYGEGDIVDALDIWGIAYADPIIKNTARELEGRRLAGMVVGDFDSDRVVVRDEEFSQIALLPREILGRVNEIEQASALLGLVLRHIAPNDPGWRDQRTVRGTRTREAVDVPVRGALWVGDLRSRAWVPVRGEDDKPAKAVAEPATLTPLLDPAWLEGNDAAIALLTECFGFDELDLRLLGIAPDAQERVRRSLAKLIESAGSDPDVYESLANELEARQRRQRDVQRCRHMGYAVQDAVKRALESYGLSVKLVDLGFDYEVSLPADDEIIEDGAVRFEVGPYFVEVKATAVGPARLTPTQAATAAARKDSYVLCVIDLREVADERLDAPWDGPDVEPLASVLTDIGERVSDTCVLVQRARESSIGIRNESALRYEVPPPVWMLGTSIADWVAAISGELG